jgi:ribosomal protein S12 methylthiotransferase accessory factor
LRERLVDAYTGPITSLRFYEPTPEDPPLRHCIAALVDEGWQAIGHSVVICGGAASEPSVAEAAGLGEAIERACAVLPRRDELVIAPYAEVQAEAADPLAWDLFDPATRAESEFPYARPSRSEPISWVWGWSVTRSKPTLIPASRVFLALESPVSGDFTDCQLLSGFAAGNTLEEATLRGLLEVIERDAFMIAWANRLLLRHARAASAAGTDASAFDRQGLEARCGVIDLDLGASVAIAMVRSTRPDDPAMVISAAADLDPVRACGRALNELAANRLHVRHLLANAGNAVPTSSPREVRDETGHGLLYAHAEMLPELAFWWDSVGSDALTTPSTPKASSAGSTWVQLSAVVESIRGAGHEVLVADLTAPEVRELGLWTVKALVPGAYPMNFDGRWPHFGGARIIEAPIRAGMRDHKLDVHELNRVPHPFP